MKNKTIFLVLFFLVWMAGFSFAQNAIDYVDSYYWSGYQQPISDGNMLYVNCLNGHGVERYDISDPAIIRFIDKEAQSGFDIIDFSNRLMIESIGNKVQIADFTDFTNTNIISSIQLPMPIMYNGLRLLNDRLLIFTADNIIRTYDLSDPANPILRFAGSFQYNQVLFGTRVALCYNWPEGQLPFIYDITNYWIYS